MENVIFTIVLVIIRNERLGRCTASYGHITWGKLERNIIVIQQVQTIFTLAAIYKLKYIYKIVFYARYNIVDHVPQYIKSNLHVSLSKLVAKLHERKFGYMEAIYSAQTDITKAKYVIHKFSDEMFTQQHLSGIELDVNPEKLY